MAITFRNTMIFGLGVGVSAGFGAGMAAAIGAANGGVVRAHVAAAAAIFAIQAFAIGLVTGLVCSSRSLSLRTKVALSVFFQASCNAVMIFALRHFGVIGNVGTGVFAGICGLFFLKGLVQLATVRN